jgi:hypothetical protein
MFGSVFEPISQIKFGIKLQLSEAEQVSLHLSNIHLKMLERTHF